MMVEEGIKIVRSLLVSSGCNQLSNKELCNYLKIACQTTNGRYPLGVIALKAAALALDNLAQTQYATGNIKTMTVSYSGATSGGGYHAIANRWRDEADKAIAQLQPKIAIVRSSGQNPFTYISGVLKSCGCKTVPNTAVQPVNCNWECCDDC